MDVFFDIEADPWAAEDGTGFGLEYLLGVAYQEAGEERYEAIWGTDRDGERLAFERFIDLVTARRAADPGMHVYHYGGYESGAVKRLMQRHGTRAEALDQLLRDEVFVDLLGVVRQGLRASVESYSLKRIEKFYLPERTGPVTDAGFSVVEFEAWLVDHDDRHLRDLADYNRDDCISTLRLRGWLERLRSEAVDVRGWDLARPSTTPQPPSEALLDAIEQTRRREAALRDGISADPQRRSAEDQGRWLLADVIDWHRREDRPQWWNWYRLRDASLDDLIGEREALSGLEFQVDVETRRQSVVRRYRFPQQETKLRPGDKPFDPDGGEKGEGAGEIVAIDLAAGTLDLVRGPAKLDYHPVRLIPAAPIPTDQQRAALGQLADLVVERGIDAEGPWRAGRDLVLRRRPRLRDGVSHGALVQPGESVVEAARRLALELDGGVLAIQGPPGTGKTWTGARMIVDLVLAGRTVGVTAQAHKAITNLLDAFDEAATEAHLVYRAIQKCDEGDDGSTRDAVTRENSPGKVASAVAAGDYPIVAGTPWLFAREDMREVGRCAGRRRGRPDVARQRPRHRAAPAARSSCSVIPTSCRRSARASIPRVPARPPSSTSSATRSPSPRIWDCCSTRRTACTRTSTATSRRTFYGGAVEPAPALIDQSVADGEPGGVGIRWRPVVHAGNDSSAPQEAEVVVDALAALIGRSWTDQHGRRAAADGAATSSSSRRTTSRSPPSSRQPRARGIDAWVGTVDKFQGQEGAVAIYSMTSSSAEDAPRGMDFLYERNRLNVAISRARALAILVASPELLRVHCRTPDQMRKANALCAYLEMARSGGA